MDFADDFDEVEEEIEALKSLYAEEEIQVTPKSTENGRNVFVNLRPLTGGDDDQVLVQCTLKMTLSGKYPDSEGPVLALSNTKGLSDKDVKKILDQLKKEVEEYLGEPVLPLLCNSCQEMLTGFNHADCSICLEPLGSGDMAGVRTGCFHTFHSACISEWYLRRAVAVAAGDFSSKEEDLVGIEETIGQLESTLEAEKGRQAKVKKSLKQSEREFKYFSKTCNEWDQLTRSLTPDEKLRVVHDKQRRDELETHVCTLKGEKKVIKQAIDKLLWRLKETIGKSKTLSAAKEKSKDGTFGKEFVFPCPVCRTQIPYEGVVEKILAQYNGHPLYRGGGANTKLVSLTKEEMNYIKKVQTKQGELKASLKCLANVNSNKEKKGGGNRTENN